MSEQLSLFPSEPKTTLSTVWFHGWMAWLYIRGNEHRLEAWEVYVKIRRYYHPELGRGKGYTDAQREYIKGYESLNVPHDKWGDTDVITFDTARKMELMYGDGHSTSLTDGWIECKRLHLGKKGKDDEAEEDTET